MKDNKLVIDVSKVVIILIVLGISLLLLLSSLGVFKNKSFRDKDLDGFISKEFGGDDCDDANALVNPQGKDLPDDKIDQNCDGIFESLNNLKDNDDFDMDGYKFSVDCNDTASMTHPNAEEIFDFSDNNCDGNVDEGFYQITLYENFIISSYDPQTII